MTPEEIAGLAHLRRARDLMDRDFRAAHGETPSHHRVRATTATEMSCRRA